ncbi:putative oxidoreductase [Rhizobium leguminosarum]|uniref:Short-chain dehydrogenase/reductase SDR n=2 Tax=Rhizobium leguminosarum TaxID=384 RepID=A0ABF7QWB5_RHILW|nr:SDR family NAD(P)-dependent oxidoreductase [Rhizobium leguminosarum]ACI58369.1 short-chain dehydrogenase/reductase SDR [Rhizobium leguminosarum bv. trifolii WSM2304]MBB5663931.1 putative oxidoreductase [Rhizobium leguminosarum]NYJ10913.1 putative oxidoreductase [Rhizobium leguminosarum]
MNFSNSTILITGGNSGIGRGLAQALAAQGAKVIITGRNAATLAETLAANPTIQGYELEVTNPDQINAFVSKITADHPDLNAVIHNAGIMIFEDVLAEPYDLDIVERTIATNLLAPIRLTAALLPHLKSKPEAAIVTVSSGLAFVPRADALTYSATKAAIHSWTQSLRHELRKTKISVVELAPPLVATDLTPGQSANPHAMPLDAFVSEAVALLCAAQTPQEVLVQRVMPQRTAEQTDNFDKVFGMINPD